MGRPKQLLPVGGRPLLEGVGAEACGSNLDEVLVVVGANAGAILAQVGLGRATPEDYAKLIARPVSVR